MHSFCFSRVSNLLDGSQDTWSWFRQYLICKKIVHNWDQFTDSFVDFKMFVQILSTIFIIIVCVCGEKSLSYTNQ